MNNRYVYGSYVNYVEAESVADTLVTQGVPAHAISIVSDDNYAEQVEGTYDNFYVNNREDNRNWFEKLFGLNDDHLDNRYAIDETELDSYNQILNEGGYLVVVDNEYRDLMAGAETVDTQGGLFQDRVREDLDVNENPEFLNNNLNETERIKLHEERLNVDKEKRDVGEVEITKEVIEETQTIEVPIEREELHIRRTNTHDRHDVDGDAFQEEDIVIPLSEEEVHVNKETVVTGEVEITKESHTENREVTETTRREDIDVHGDDNIVVEDKEIKDDDLF